MSIAHLKSLQAELLKKKVEVNAGRQLPTIYDLAIAEGRKLNAAFVYADLKGFTKIVASQPSEISFKLLHIFVDFASRITSFYGGDVIDCAGDRTLSVFWRSSADRSPTPIREALTAAQWVQTAVARVVVPVFSAQRVPVSVSIGIDYGAAVIGCVGMRGNKRLVFFGDAANIAAKLQERGSGGDTLMSEVVYKWRPRYMTPENGWEIELLGDDPQNRYYRTTALFTDDTPVLRSACTQ